MGDETEGAVILYEQSGDFNFQSPEMTKPRRSAKAGRVDVSTFLQHAHGSVLHAATFPSGLRAAGQTRSRHDGRRQAAVDRFVANRPLVIGKLEARCLCWRVSLPSVAETSWEAGFRMCAQHTTNLAQ
jgi:hypothetical protein